jgi:hypothetical protein
MIRGSPKPWALGFTTAHARSAVLSDFDCCIARSNIPPTKLMRKQTLYSSDRRRPAGFVTFTPSTFALGRDIIKHRQKATKEEENRHEPFQNHRAFPAADPVCDLGRKTFVVHQKEIDLARIVHQHFLEAVWKQMASLEKSCLSNQGGRPSAP